MTASAESRYIGPPAAHKGHPRTNEANPDVRCARRVHGYGSKGHAGGQIAPAGSERVKANEGGGHRLGWRGLAPIHGTPKGHPAAGHQASWRVALFYHFDDPGQVEDTR